MVMIPKNRPDGPGIGPFGFGAVRFGPRRGATARRRSWRTHFPQERQLASRAWHRDPASFPLRAKLRTRRPLSQFLIRFVAWAARVRAMQRLPCVAKCVVGRPQRLRVRTT